MINNETLNHIETRDILENAKEAVLNTYFYSETTKEICRLETIITYGFHPHFDCFKILKNDVPELMVKIIDVSNVLKFLSVISLRPINKTPSSVHVFLQRPERDVN